YGAEEVGRAYRRAQALCGAEINVGEQAAVLLGLWAFTLVRAEHAAALEVADVLFRQAKEAGDTVLLLPALFTRGTSLLHMGDPAAALASLKQASESLDAWQLLPTLTSRFEGVDCLIFAALAAWLLGDPEQALAYGRQAVPLAQQ